MTETDRIYIAIVETMKKHGVEQSIGALSKYITTGNTRYFTSTNGARKMIAGLTPAQVLQDALRSIIKYEQIMTEKGFARMSSDDKLVDRAISEYKQGQKVSTELSSGDLGQLVIKMTSTNVEDAIRILAQNSDLFESFLAQYSAIVCNCRNELNQIPNDNFPQINEYFARFEVSAEKKRA